MAKLNSFEQVNITVEEIAKLKHLERTRKNNKKKGSKFTMIDLFLYPSLRWKTIGLMIVQASIALLYFAPNLLLSDYQFSTFSYGLIYGLITLSSTLGTYKFIQKFKRRFYAIACFVITLSWSIGLIYIYRSKS